jgi:acid stress-induced BolA-like protein IbaG/YrbA
MAEIARLTKAELERILTRKLSLKDPQFFLEQYGSLLGGDIISSTFKGKRDHQRQDMIWDALEAELGSSFKTRVGMLLAYTPDEWNLGAEPVKTPKRKKVG